MLLASRPLCALLLLRSRPTVLARLLDRRVGFGSKKGLLVEFLVVVLSRVVLRLAVGVVEFGVGGDVDARGTRSCAIWACLSLLSV